MSSSEGYIEDDPRFVGCHLGLGSNNKYIIHFPYSRVAEGKIKPGILIAVENFQSEDRTKRYSILQVDKAFPTHYALSLIHI